MTVLNLVDIQSVEFNPLASLEEKAISFIEQIKDPYHFSYDKYEVEISFIGHDKLEDKLVNCLSSK